MDDLADAIAAWLRGIGLSVQAAELPADTFLPGLTVEAGRLLYDPAGLTYPGDLLHEAGHLAVAPASARPAMGAGVDVPGVDMGQLEVAAMCWSYAAALAVGVAPSVVFHDGGYRGKARGLLNTFGVGVYPGAHLLEAAGMTATGPRAEALGVPPFPHMLRWLAP